MPATLSAKEQEVILLNAVMEIVGEMVNFDILKLIGADPDSEVRFQTATHQRFFNIVLVDFLSRTDSRAPLPKTAYLAGLRSIATHPSFDIEDSISSLRKSVEKFTSWLNQEIIVEKVYFPSIQTETDLRLSRLTFLKMCGDIAKHNVLRAVGVAEDLKDILAGSQINIDLEDALLLLATFYERFHDDILNYHGSTIAEFLNNIRWGIFEYLRPELERSGVREILKVWDRAREGDEPMCKYEFPPEIASKLGRDCYWNLMNSIRTPPYMRKFQVSRFLKMRY